jgi:hypothetical protein
MSLEVEQGRVPDPRYPVGDFVEPVGGVISLDERLSAIEELGELPGQLRNAVDGLDAQQLATPYREGGWTVRQVVHHVADSHMNAFVRMRLALTEDWPAVKTYDEAAWSKLHDSEAPVEWSLELVEALHARWVMMLQVLTAEQWKRGYVHPEDGRVGLELAVLMYGWHSRHHVAHITHLRAAKGW